MQGLGESESPRSLFHPFFVLKSVDFVPVGADTSSGGFGRLFGAVIAFNFLPSFPVLLVVPIKLPPQVVDVDDAVQLPDAFSAGLGFIAVKLHIVKFLSVWL